MIRTTAGRINRRPGLPRRFASLAMLVVLAMQILASGLAFSAPPRDPGDDHLIVCTAAGMVDLGTADAPAAPTMDHGRLCVFCLPLLQGALTTPTAAAPPPVPGFVFLSAEAGGEIAGPYRRPRNLAGGASPHAPPSS